MRVSSPFGSVCGLLAAALLPLSSLAQQDPSINVALKTSFEAGPYLIELLETAALENSTCYFPLLDRIADGTFLEVQTEKELYERFLELLHDDGHLQNHEALSSFKFALALRAAAPRVEAHYQYYETSIKPYMMAAQDAACPVWVHLDGQQYCSPTLERAQQPVDLDDSDVELPFDRTLGDATDTLVTVLYADITHPLFGQFHETVSRTAKEGKSSYRVRYRPSSADKRQSLFVSGYGTELVLKRTDYIVIDDRDAAELEDEKSKAGTGGTEKTPDLKSLTTTELATLGLHAASYIMSSESPFDTLVDVSANFPRMSSNIAKSNASDDFLSEHFANREKLLPAGFNAVWMNGLQVEKRHLNAYSMLDSLRKERQLIGQLKEIGLSATQAVNLLSHDVLAQATSEGDAQRYDFRDTEEGGPVIIWLNDIEEDRQYETWASSLRVLLQRTYPGQLPQVRRNIHHLIVPLDLSNVKDLDLTLSTLYTMVRRMLPIRIGLVPVGDSEAAISLAKVSHQIFDTYGVRLLMRFYQNILETKKGLSNIEAVFDKTFKDVDAKDGRDSLHYTDALKSETALNIQDRLTAYKKRLALKGKDLAVFINGVAIPRDESWFDKMSQRLTTDLRTLQIGVYEETLPDDTNIVEHFLSAAVSRRSTLIAPNESKDIRIIDVADLSARFPELFSSLPQIGGAGESALLGDRAHVLVAVDVDTGLGRQIIAAAYEFYKKHTDVQIVFVHTGKTSEGISNAAYKLWSSALTGARSENSLETLIEHLDTDSTPVDDDMKSQAAEYWLSQQALIKELGLVDRENGIWLNGRIIGPLEDVFEAADFEALLNFERNQRIAPVATAITGLGLEDVFREPLNLAKITSIVARSLVSDIPPGIHDAPPPVRLNKMKDWSGKHTLIHSPAEGEPTIQIVATIDPASEVSQPWIPLLKTLSQLGGVDVKVFLNPQNRLEELPIKRFFSQVLSSAPSFESDGSLSTPRASFKDVPPSTLFNLGMVVPPSWLVAPKESIYDLDNIKLSSVPAGQNVDAVYELEHILVEGHSRDMTRASPPRGVQLLLGTEREPHFADTIIMANLGYFQFKANPGNWKITLKPGRSSKIFTLDSVGAKGYAPQTGDGTTSVALLSFQGVTLYPRLSRKAGMAEEEVLETSAADILAKGASFASSAWSSLGIGKSKTSGNADINIFSVASGHLYERMLNIMMVSVMRHTKHSVKFWFIEQFLSPSFKASLPHLAEHYKFKYELVTYKWPHWLRGQKEKQREIWGYKILFLDVLFPLSLDKVIFVDADQIVRTDMLELNKVDLQGAPYGFTPMCDSRTEMEGFRFWKQGYWKNFLEGKPYHISALYVVDLKKFRELAAGDRLRGQYHSLSADPASLSNLDQDLPNHMQHVLPIHSLNQEWLWCETWCSDESLKDARTIDLCNNPQTKEPKLDRARRQVPEWTELDEEIAQVLKQADFDVVKGSGAQKILNAGDEREVKNGNGDVKDEL